MPKKLPFDTIAEFIHSLGERGKTAKALDINPRTLTTRLENPGTFTLAELQRVAEYGHTDLMTVTLLAEHQMKNPIEPPAPALGRPARQH
ncbi:hypothetical protein SAMN00120144_3628 [Hymenobacter roseosalivarius DSM 11622]|uniref:XRE family transcriptional regulator n=1 Tax=Hymenobacter roseosalivarius DSM 11622 TaxID=645990 RepID=A0A1W1UIW8_9BACT|nr:hypothetical protein [Hymenobacter roseosalivarius]SMB80979.1 hypothetical protein SAMN00120144_3628 [Hymenobacter roseosalivarius DSM 11622]